MRISEKEMEMEIEVEIRSHIGIITFNRPSSLNAFNTNIMRNTQAAMQKFEENDQVRCIIVKGNGRAFSAGFDMKESAQRNISTENEWREVLEEDFNFIMQFWNNTKPTIAVAHGHCIGGALELLMACDLAVAEKSTLFGEPEVRFGSGIVAMLAPWMATPKHAKELLLTGNNEISAQRIYDMGIINRIADNGKGFEVALKLAHEISAAAPKSVQITKNSINRSYELAKMKEALLEGLEADIKIESDLASFIIFLFT